MIRNGKTTYNGVLDIPKGVLGKFAIDHIEKPPNTCFNLATARTAIIGGDKSGKVMFSRPTRWHQLSEGKAVWMTDLPIEQAQHDKLLATVRRGSVLVGGLGLGYAATVLAQRSGISRVVVVEKSSEVIGLVWKHLFKGNESARAKATVVHADLFDYLKYLREQKTVKFTHAFYDTWASDSESTFFNTVCPLLKLSDDVVRGRPICWNENVMRGQLYLGLTGKLFMLSQQGRDIFPDTNMPTLEELATPRNNIWWDWAAPFWKWVKENPKATGEGARERAVSAYVRSYGLPRWREWWEALIEQPA